MFSQYFLPFLLLLLPLIPFINGQQNSTLPLKCRPPRETLNPCGKRCEARCGDPPGGRPCVRICDPPACVCAKGYARNTETGRCVLKAKCPSPDDGVPTNPCAATDCISGSNCVVVDGQAKCVPNSPDVCATKTCPPGQVCYPQVVQCKRAPCPPIAECRDPCMTVRCAAGYKCVTQQVQCFAPPCPPITGCVRIDEEEAAAENGNSE